MRTMDDIKHFLFEQLEKLQQFSAIGMPAMLVINLAISVFNLIKWRGISPYVGISILTFSIMFIYWSMAHLIVKKGETYRSKARAAIKFNPYSIWAISPIQWMLMKHIWVPVLKKQAETKEEKAEVAMVENWMEIGYIPKKDFPDNLKKFYMPKKEKRL